MHLVARHLPFTSHRQRVLSAPASPVPWTKLRDTPAADSPARLGLNLSTFTEETDSDANFNMSTEFLEHGEHQLFYNLPWERPVDLETVDGAMYSLKVSTVAQYLLSTFCGLPACE